MSINKQSNTWLLVHVDLEFLFSCSTLYLCAPMYYPLFIRQASGYPADSDRNNFFCRYQNYRMSASKIWISVPWYFDNLMYCTVTVEFCYCILFLVIRISINLFENRWRTMHVGWLIAKQLQIVVNCTLYAYHLNFSFNKSELKYWLNNVVSLSVWGLKIVFSYTFIEK